jgi:hypothetical protein
VLTDPFAGFARRLEFLLLIMQLALVGRCMRR